MTDATVMVALRQTPPKKRRADKYSVAPAPAPKGPDASELIEWVRRQRRKQP